jgi:hypothetical protein
MVHLASLCVSPQIWRTYHSTMEHIPTHCRPSPRVSMVREDRASVVPLSNLKTLHVCTAFPTPYLPALEVLKN